MNSSELMHFEKKFEQFMVGVCNEDPDPSQDILHVQRVVGLAKRIADAEGANLKVVVPAAYLHDCVYISKADSRRKQASRISADKAIELLREWHYPEKFYSGIHHAIAAHSFSANIPAETIEAKVVQDADRLDAIGAIGIFRAFAFSGVAKRRFYNPEAPFAGSARDLDDQSNTLDHFFTKLLLLKDKLHTASAKQEAEVRMRTMTNYLDALEIELS